jgi:hypothetical protein
MKISAKSKVFLALSLLLCACSSARPAANSPLEAIEQIRILAGFPKSTVSFVETTTMINSPNGDLQVDLYQDEEGRKFFVDPGTNTVVEIDARDLMIAMHSPTQPTAVTMTSTELERRAKAFMHAAIPNFSSLEGSLTYEAGAKVNTFFFTWRAANPENSFMPPFIQVAMTGNGDIFGFINTVTIH